MTGRAARFRLGILPSGAKVSAWTSVVAHFASGNINGHLAPTDRAFLFQGFIAVETIVVCWCAQGRFRIRLESILASAFLALARCECSRAIAIDLARGTDETRRSLARILLVRFVSQFAFADGTVRGTIHFDPVPLTGEFQFTNFARFSQIREFDASVIFAESVSIVAKAMTIDAFAVLVRARFLVRAAARVRGSGRRHPEIGGHSSSRSASRSGSSGSRASRLGTSWGSASRLGTSWGSASRLGTSRGSASRLGRRRGARRGRSGGLGSRGGGTLDRNQPASQQ
jgi:hypothetical protein